MSNFIDLHLKPVQAYISVGVTIVFFCFGRPWSYNNVNLNKCIRNADKAHTSLVATKTTTTLLKSVYWMKLRYARTMELWSLLYLIEISGCILIKPCSFFTNN